MAHVPLIPIGGSSHTELDASTLAHQGEIMAGVYQAYRRSTVRVILLGGVLILIVLQLRYRAVIPGLLAFLPPGLAALATLGLFGLLGTPVSVVSAISLMVVLGMGVDYGIFAVDSAGRHDRPGTTLSRLLISCLRLFRSQTRDRIHAHRSRERQISVPPFVPLLQP